MKWVKVFDLLDWNANDEKVLEKKKVKSHLLKVLQKKLMIILTNTSVEALISMSFFRLPYLTFLEVNIIIFHGLSHHKELWWNIAYCSPTIGPYAPCFILVSIIACILWIIALVYVTYAHACLNCGHPSRFMNLNLQYSAMFRINS